MSIQAIARKVRRALRNGTGVTITNAELIELSELGFLRWLAVMEADEICPAKVDAFPLPPVRTASTSPTDGSPAPATDHRRSGKSRTQANALANIAAHAGDA